MLVHVEDSKDDPVMQALEGTQREQEIRLTVERVRDRIRSRDYAEPLSNSQEAELKPLANVGTFADGLLFGPIFGQCPFLVG